MSQRDDDQHTDDQYRFHMDAIRRTLDRWRAGELTTWQKRKAIADENRASYDTPPPALVAAGRRYEAPAVLADAAAKASGATGGWYDKDAGSILRSKTSPLSLTWWVCNIVQILSGFPGEGADR